ncbi:MAG: glycosyltransferase family 4 protein [wastewater metagenome]|nr:glycosyltransferase family 4 protein [Candidatus Loosdrechtia aerotolerans]
MKIAQVAPLVERVPPEMYGGTERVVFYLTEELVKRGHEVTLFASGDSITSAKLVSVHEKALRLDHGIENFYPYHIFEMGLVYERAKEFDIIHSHNDYLTFPFIRLVSTPTVLTLHGRLNIPDIQKVYKHYRDCNFISISNAQREFIPELNWTDTVYNGCPIEKFPFQQEPGDYLVFVGRISPEKGPVQAIEIAKRAGMKLVMVAKVDPYDKAYYEEKVKPLITPPFIEYVGEKGEEERNEIMKKAKALILPLDWPEPFGLVVIESLACGTPVITKNRGSMPEIMRHGKTGFICETLDEMVDAVQKIESIDRMACRRYVEENFTISHMVDRYEKAYNRLIIDKEYPKNLVVLTEQGVCINSY